MVLVALVLGCSEYRVRGDDPVPPAEPPGEAPDPQGEPPSDWAACPGSLLGRYHNLDASHPDVLDGASPAPDDPALVDWWDDDRLVFSAWDPTLEFGADWWPVDDGLEGDPAHFAVRWTGWVRAWSGTELQLLLGAADDVYVRLGEDVVAAITDSGTVDPDVVSVPLRPGVLPLEVSFAHRRAVTAGMRFRVVGGDVTVCAPVFPAR